MAELGGVFKMGREFDQGRGGTRPYRRRRHPHLVGTLSTASVLWPEACEGDETLSADAACEVRMC